MKCRFWRGALVWSTAVLFSLTLSLAQRGGRGVATDDTQQEDTRLPNGKLQRDEILKAEHEQNVKDAAQLVELAQQLQQDIEKNDRFVLSLSTLKKTDDIEKLVKKLRTRLRHN
jgi:hypothetical protein